MNINRKLRMFCVVIVAPLLALFFFPVISNSAASAPTLGTTPKFAVLAATSIANTGTTTISGTSGGDIGLSPGTSYTGSGSVTQNGVAHINDATAATAKTDLTAAISSMKSFTYTPLAGGSDLAGKTILPGNYTSATGKITNTGNVIFDGQDNSASIFIIKASSEFTTSTGSTVTLINGAQPCHVYWSVGSTATLGASSTFAGYIFAGESVTANSGAKIKGSLFSSSDSVTLNSNTITNDSCTAASVASATPTATASATPTATASATPTASASATPTPTASASATPKATATSGGVGGSGSKGDKSTTAPTTTAPATPKSTATSGGVGGSGSKATTSTTAPTTSAAATPTTQPSATETPDATETSSDAGATGSGGDSLPLSDAISNTNPESSNSNIIYIVLIGLGILLFLVVGVVLILLFIKKIKNSERINDDNSSESNKL